MAINREWHEKNRMPKNPSEQQQIEWHVAHAQNCDCRPMPEWVKAQVAKGKKKTSAHTMKYVTI
jgi:hypothetical protein